jgi:mRNA-degrading endonuclease RelE of RelBE toxin-antitoxin system
MSWILDYVPEARKDIKDLNRSQQIVVNKALKKVKETLFNVQIVLFIF